MLHDIFKTSPLQILLPSEVKQELLQKWSSSKKETGKPLETKKTAGSFEEGRYNHTTIIIGLIVEEALVGQK